MLTTLAAGIVVPLLLILWSGKGPVRRSPWPAIAVLLWYGSGLVRAAAANVRAPREWDFACFWLYGHLAAGHQNIYDPAAFARFASPFATSDEFRLAVLNVGFPYPPPTIALFYPLGYATSVPVALAVWYTAQFAALAAAAWILARLFFPADGRRAGLLLLAIVAALPATLQTVDNAQTNFIVLLLVALALRDRDAPGGAVWEVLALWVKPYAAALLLFDAVCGRRRRLLTALGAAALSFAGAALLLGPAALAAYVHSNPSSREPAFAFTEQVNQSLLALVLRMHAMPRVHVWALGEPLFVAASLVLASVTAVMCARTTHRSEAGFAVVLLLGLIVYPGTLSSYGVILAIPFLVLWRNRTAFPGGSATVAAILFAAVVLQGGVVQRSFAAYVLSWAACLYLLLVAQPDGHDAMERPKNSLAAATTAAGAGGV